MASQVNWFRMHIWHERRNAVFPTPQNHHLPAHDVASRNLQAVRLTICCTERMFHDGEGTVAITTGLTESNKSYK